MQRLTLRPPVLLIVWALSPLLFPVPAFARVIYDVTVNYSGSGHTAQYSFAMEFLSAPPPWKTEGNLLPSSGPGFDFTGETLRVDGVAWALVSDRETDDLCFELAGGPACSPDLSFQSSDLFQRIVGDFSDSVQFFTEGLAGVMLGNTLIPLDVASVSVAERRANAAEPGTLLLVGVTGFLLWGARRARGHRPS